jgi:hypothetical protein
MHRFRSRSLLVLGLLIWLQACAATRGTYGPATSHPRPSGYEEAGAPAGEPLLNFTGRNDMVGVITDLTASFPKNTVKAFAVERVYLNEMPVGEFVVRNHNVFNGNRHVHGNETFTLELLSNWEAGKSYTVAIEGTEASGGEVVLELSGLAPDSRRAFGGPSFGRPTPDLPYHHVSFTLAEGRAPGKVMGVTIDGARVRDIRTFESGIRSRDTAEKTEAAQGESYDQSFGGKYPVRVVAPWIWHNNESYTAAVTVTSEDGTEHTYEQKGTAPSYGGHWRKAWTQSMSVVLHDTSGLWRMREPVHLSLGLFADQVGDPAQDIRIVTFDPDHPRAGVDGYVLEKHQVISSHTWNDRRVTSQVERDAETGQRIHRYSPTTTVELVFLADVLPYEEKIFQVLYGNASPAPMQFHTDLRVQGKGLQQTIANNFYRVELSSNSGAVETVAVLGDGDPVLLEHKLETNGAVHWNPGFYAPPEPWVHMSDWERPSYSHHTGALMHRTRRHAMLPHLDNVSAQVSYTFYAHQPYILMESLMEVREDLFAKAVRNAELVFNHDVLNEFVWLDPMGVVQRMDIDTSRKHPVHAIEVAADTPWMAFVNREQGIGFAAISLAYENTNRYGHPPSIAQPYLYVQNGPWIYWSRPLVYPFGTNNLTRMMHVRKGSMYFERWAWVPFRFPDEGDPFERVAAIAEKLRHPLEVREWMRTDPASPEDWIMPILTAPFDEGVSGAVGSVREEKETE